MGTRIGYRAGGGRREQLGCGAGRGRLWVRLAAGGLCRARDGGVGLVDMAGKEVAGDV